MPQTTFTIAVTADDGYVGGNLGTYPVTLYTHADPAGTVVASERSWFSGLTSYYTRNGLLRWDTSSIPDTATVVGAQLKMAASDIAAIDNLDAMGEWYTWTPAMSAAHFTPTPASTAFSVPLSTLVEGDYNTIGLSNLEGNINKSGYTGIRLHTSQRASDAPPTDQNRHVWHSIDNVGGFTAPQLIVSYIESPVFRQKSEGSGTVSSGSNISVTMPTGTVEDDRMLAAITLQGGTNVTITPPAGWSLVDRINSTTALATAVYQKAAAMSEAGPYSFGITLSGGGSAKYAYACESYYTAEIGVTEIDAASSQANASSTSVASPTIDTLIGNSLIVFAGAVAVGGTSGATWTPPSGMTERADVASGTATGSSAIKKFYLMGGTLTNSYQPTQEDGTAPADAAFATATGWILSNTAAGNYAELRPNTERAANQFNTTAVPTALGTGASANAFRTTNALTGTFAAGNWTLSAVLRSVTAAMATGQTGRLRWRVYKSANADGTSATELTSGVVLSNTVAGTGNTTTNQGTRTATWSASQIVLSSEYLFFACAYEVVANSGTGTTRDANFRQNTNSAITTPTFTLTADVAIELAEAAQVAQGPTGTKTATAQNAGVNTGTLIALASPIPGIVDKDATLLWDVRTSVDAGVGLAPSIGLAPSVGLAPAGAALHLLWDVGQATTAIAATIDSESDVSAVASVARSVAATSAGVSSLTAAGAVQGPEQVAAMVSAHSTLSANARASWSAASAISATSTAAATASRTRLAASAIASTSSVAASARAQRLAVSAISASSTLAASASVKRSVASVIAATSTTSGVASVTRRIAAASAGASSVSASASVSHTVGAASTIASASTLQATARVTRGVAATVSSTSTLAATPRAIRSIAAIISSASTVAAAPRVLWGASASTSSASNAFAQAQVWRLVSAQITGVSGLEAVVVGFGDLPTPDSRTLFVLFENRTTVIVFENRSTLALLEDRVAEVDDENSVLAIS